MAIIIIAEKVVENTDDWMVEITRQRHIKHAREQTPGIKGKLIAFIRLNKTTVDLVVICFLFGFCGVMLGVSLGHSTWTIRKSMDFTLSTLCTCGYLGLPVHALPWKYVILSIYTNCGVPFLSIGLGTVCILYSFYPIQTVYDSVSYIYITSYILCMQRAVCLTTNYMYMTIDSILIQL